MLEKVLGSETAMKIMLHIAHYKEVHPSAVAKDYKIALSGVQKQCARFEDAGILVSKLVGRTRVYSFNLKSKVAKTFSEMIKLYYDSLSVKDKEKIFSSRGRPRRAGKPIIKKSKS